MSPMRGEKPQNRPTSKLNTGALHFAQCCRKLNLYLLCTLITAYI